MRIARLVYLVLLVPAAAFGFEVRGMQAPESFIVDPATGVYYVSNVNGAPTVKDNNGFIAKIDPSGKLLALDFIVGGKDQVELHAPKGLAISGNDLYVTDIDVVQRFDKNTGHLVGTIDLKQVGAVFLNDITVDTKGNIYISDTHANIIYQVDPAKNFKVTILAKGEGLENPNGLLYDPTRKRLIVATWGTGKILSVDMNGKIMVLVNKQFKNLDGIDFDSRGNLIVSSFTEGKIYRIKNYSTVEVVKEHMLTPADISFDQKNKLILIPSFEGNLVFTHPLN